MKKSTIISGITGFLLAGAIAVNAAWGPLTQDFPNGGIHVGGPAIVQSSFVSGIQNVTAATTTPIDLSNGNTVDLNLVASITTMTVTNAYPGEHFEILVEQAGGGSHTISWPSAFKFASGTAPTLTSTNGKRDVIGFKVDSSGNYAAEYISQNQSH